MEEAKRKQQAQWKLGRFSHVKSVIATTGQQRNPLASSRSGPTLNRNTLAQRSATRLMDNAERTQTKVLLEEARDNIKQEIAESGKTPELTERLQKVEKALGVFGADKIYVEYEPTNN